MVDGLGDSAIIQLTTAFITVTGFGFQYWRESRAHRWDTEERARIAADIRVRLEQEAAALRLKLETEHASLAVKVVRSTEIAEASRDDIKKAVAEVKQEANNAYREANHVNIKISDLNERLLNNEKNRTDVQKKS